MKILHVTNFFKPSWESGGVTRVVYELSKKLVDHGHEVTVYTTDGYKFRLDVQKNKSIDVDGIKVYYFRNLIHKLVIKANITIPYYLLLIASKQIKEYDIIHIHEHRTLLAACVQYYAKKQQIPYILQSHGTVLKIMRMNKFKTLFDWLFGYNILNGSVKLIAVSQIEVEQYRKMNVPDEKIVLIPNGINLKSFANLPEGGLFRKKYNFMDEYIILFLGRLNKIKGIDFLIQSYAILARDMDNVVLILAGPDDGYQKELQEKISALDLASKVKFIGAIDGDNKLSAYLDADLLVYPSVFEIFGLVPFEAIMCGTPVIVTNDCGCGQYIQEANAGFVVKYNDVDQLSEKIRYLYENPEIGDLLVENGKNYILNNFSWDHVIKKIEDLYDKSRKN